MNNVSGLVTLGGFFVLRERSSLVFSLVGGAHIDFGSKVKIFLGEGIPGRPATVVLMAGFGRAQIMRSAFQCESTMSLRPGRYTWQAEISGGSGHTASMRGGVSIVESQRTFSTRGIGELAAVLSTTGARRAKVWARIPHVTLSSNDWIEGRLKVIELNESLPNAIGVELFSTRVFQRDTEFDGGLDTEVYPYLPRLGFRYRASFTVDSNLATPPDITIEQEIE